MQDVLNVMGAVPNEQNPIVRRERVEKPPKRRHAQGQKDEQKCPLHRYVFCDCAEWPQGVTLDTLETKYREAAHRLRVLSAKVELLHSVLACHPEKFVVVVVHRHHELMIHHDEPNSSSQEELSKRLAALDLMKPQQQVRL